MQVCFSRWLIAFPIKYVTTTSEALELIVGSVTLGLDWRSVTILCSVVCHGL